MYLLLTEKRKDDCVFLGNKEAFFLEPMRMLCGFPTDTFLFKLFDAHEQFAELIHTQKKCCCLLPAFSNNAFQSCGALTLRRSQIITGFISILQMFFSFP